MEIKSKTFDLGVGYRLVLTQNPLGDEIASLSRDLGKDIFWIGKTSVLRDTVSAVDQMRKLN